MSEAKGAAAPEQKEVEWEVEELKVTNGLTPEHFYPVMYRRQGERVQRQEVESISFEKTWWGPNDRMPGPPRVDPDKVPRITDFVQSHEDLEWYLETFYEGGYPILRIVGWRELITEKDIEIYEWHRKQKERFDQLQQ